MKKNTQKIFALALLAVIVVLFGCIAFCLPVWAKAEAVTALPAIDLLGIVEQYAVLPVAVVCLALGWMLKNAFPQFNNNFIPLTLLPVAIVCVLWMNNWNLTPDTAFAGFCSAALAVYIHSGGKHVMEALKKEEAKPPEL